MADADRASDSRLRGSLAWSLAVIVILVLLGGALGGLYGARKAQYRTADAAVLVAPLEGNPFSPDGNGDDLINLETESQVLQSDKVASMVASREEGNPTAAKMLAGLSVEVPPNTQILRISYSSRSAETAVRRAQLFAEEYLTYRENRAKSLVAGQSREIQKQITSRNDELQKLVNELAQTKTPSAEAEVLRAKINGVSEQLVQLRARSSELETGALAPGQIVTPSALRDEGPISVGILSIGLGALLGAALGGTFAFVRGRVDGRILTVEDIEASGISVLGSVERRSWAGHLSADDEGTPLSDDYRQLRASVLTADASRPVTVLVGSASEGKLMPDTAVELARATAAARIETILVDATTAERGLTKGPDAVPGISDVLIGAATLDAALVPISDHLTVLGRGEAASDFEDLLAAPRMEELLRDVSKRADLTIIASSSLHDAQSLALASWVEAVVPEVEQGCTRHRALTNITERYVKTTRVLGVALVYNGPRHSKARRQVRA